jgi:bifunctional non-homologous end joining protein LigD
VPASLSFIRPCEPKLVETPPTGPQWVHEPKLDGFRAQLTKDGTSVRLLSRHGKDFTHRFASLAAALVKLPTDVAIIDGEIIKPDAEGKPDFRGLIGAGRRAHVAFYAFDLLRLGTVDVAALPYLERKRRLKRHVARADVLQLHYVEHFPDGAELLKSTAELGLEGIVSKRADQPYRSGPTSIWRKTKSAEWLVANADRGELFAKR